MIRFHAAAPAGAAILLALAAAPMVAHAQLPPEEALKVRVEPVALRPGASGEARVILTLPSGYHLLADPPPTKSTHGAQLVVDSIPGVVAKTTLYPDPEELKETDTRLTYRAWRETVEFRVPITVSKKASPGSLVLKGRLRYQIYLGGEYYKPAVRAISIPVEVGAPAPPGGAGKP